MIVVSLALVAVFVAVFVLFAPEEPANGFDGSDGVDDSMGDRRGNRRADRKKAVVTGWCIVVAGAALSVVPWFGSEEPLRTPESALAAGVFGVLIAAPGLMVLVGVRTGRPAMLLPSAITLVPLSFISFALVTLPLLIPAVMLFKVTARTVSPGRWPRALLAGAAGTTQLIAALGCYIGLREEKSWSAPDGMGGGSTTGWVPWTTSALVLALIATAIVTTFAIAGPRSRPTGRPSLH